MKISNEAFQYCSRVVTALAETRQPWEGPWKEVANFYLPSRYTWLMTAQDRLNRVSSNPNIIDGTGTNAARTLAAGLMNGVTSPARPWFKLRISQFEDDLDTAAREWLDEVERRMQLVMSESNYYRSLAIMYLDLVIFGTSSMIIYEDPETVIRCYDCSLGEFYIGQSARMTVDRFARKFNRKGYQLVEEFGAENVTEVLRSAYANKTAASLSDYGVTHVIMPNNGKYGIPAVLAFVEIYFMNGQQDGEVLRVKGFNEFPVVCPRWEVTGSDTYGTSPAMDALGDVKQLQKESIAKAKGLDYMNRPPIEADMSMKHQATALVPGGINYVAGLRSGGGSGAKPIYTVNPPIGELTIDIRDIQTRIRETFYNDLFKMISQLQTVRSATEIEARQEEKLVLLGSVLQRIETEGLSPSIQRIFSMMDRAGLLPEVPESIAGAQVEIQYVSILSSAQTAVGVIPTERWLQLIGSVAAIYPGATSIPNFDELIRDYGRAIGVKAKGINSREQVEETQAEQAKLQAMREAASTGVALTQGAKNLADTEVGGGANALQKMLGA